jgi:hypothetical protein
MLKVVTHVHPPYSTDGWNNPAIVNKYAMKKGLVVELDAHNSLLWMKAYPEVYKSEHIIPGVELGLLDTDIIAVGENLDELARDKRFPLFDPKPKRMLEVPLEEGIEILRKISVEYTYLPHLTFFGGAVYNGYVNQISRVDALEVWNGCISIFPPYNRKALILAEKLNKTKLAGVDGHIGCWALNSCYNLVDANSKEEVYEAVRKGRTKPHVSLLYPIQLSKEYATLAFLTAKDILNSRPKISPSSFTSLTKQLYSV